MSETIVSIAIMQYKQSFYPICDLSEQTCKLGFFFLIILCFLLFFVTETKRNITLINSNIRFSA